MYADHENYSNNVVIQSFIIFVNVLSVCVIHEREITTDTTGNYLFI